MASSEFIRVTYNDVDEKERQQVRRQLEQYCGQDTEGMIWIVESLRNLVEATSPISDQPAEVWVQVRWSANPSDSQFASAIFCKGFKAQGVSPASCVGETE